MIFPIKAHSTKSQFADFAHGVGFIGRNDEVAWFVLLEHAPHGIDVVPSESPVALSIQIAETNLGIEPEFDSSDTIGDFSSDEFETAARAFVIEKNA